MRQKKLRLHYLYPDSTDALYRPYVTAIGQLALAWNLLHESMGHLFLSLMAESYVNQLAEVWSSVTSDRGKRDMLKAALLSKARPDEIAADAAKEKHRLLTEYVTDLLNKAEGLEIDRNNAVHAPLFVSNNALSPHAGVVYPDTFLGNVRAKKLMSKDLLSEFRWCRDYATALGKYAQEIDFAWCGHKLPWPDKLKPPNRGQKKKARGRRRQKFGQSPRRWRSSRG